MSSDDSEPAHVKPSLFIKTFSFVGAFIAVGAIATLITVVLVNVNKWDRYKYSIFGLAWGLGARWFELKVRGGIKESLASPLLTMEKRKILGEQLIMHRFTRWFVHAELSVSVILLLVELLTR